jgi:hypothetical protein
MRALVITSTNKKPRKEPKKMKKVTIRQSSENVVYVTLNGKVIYIDDSIKGELTIDAWDEETEEPIKPTLAQ